jgi:hypothetical protein
MFYVIKENTVLLWICDSSPGRVKPKTVKLVFFASPLSMQALRRKSKDWVGSELE